MYHPSSSQSTILLPAAPSAHSGSSSNSTHATTPHHIEFERSEPESDMSGSSTESSPAAEEGYTSDIDAGKRPSDRHRSPPTSPITRSSTIPSPKPNLASTHPYPRASTSASTTTPSTNATSRHIRPRGLAPLSNLKPLSAPAHPVPDALPKSQPLSRSLFTRMANDAPHAGFGNVGKRKAGGQTFIVPTRGFRTTFELDLTASEFARR
ncbi:MAG: hypothetical protein TREMPRED_004074 [Tremellales sp. Tagirdzhanova-0007]|nr:MAG: hypothetical protein TREMPRED_004074 [Tremellales sp. Tagirdzhanova-0007]